MKITSIKQMLFFIECIRETDQYINDIYLQGGCYQFHLLLNKMAPECEPRINADKNHIVTLFKNRYFDITGEVTGKFYELTLPEYYKVVEWSFAKFMALQVTECPACEEPICV